MRLIDADAFLKEYCESYPYIYQAMSSAFKHAPKVDAVPVIRCKDCIYYNKEIAMCAEPYSMAHNVVHEDDYCSMAERKEE